MSDGERFDVVVVGGGGSGAVVAARLGAAGWCVLLLEAGAAPTSTTGYPAELRDAGSLRGADPGHPDAWSYPATLAPGRPYTVVRGRILGGSTAVNGAYFVRPRRADFEQWAAAGVTGWSYDDCLPAMRRLESDADFGGRPGADVDGRPGDDGGAPATVAASAPAALHGTSGPMPVRRPVLEREAPHPATTAFAAAADALGVPREPDKNGDQPEGHGPLPQNLRRLPEGGYGRCTTAEAYLLTGASPVEVRGGAEVRRVVFEGTRAVGVEFDAAGRRTRVRAGLVVLAAGAIGTAQLLLRSGVGPREELERHGIPVRVEAPGVGAAFSDHPQFALPWHARPGVLRSEGPLFEWALNTTLPLAETLDTLGVVPTDALARVELLPMLRGLRSALGQGSAAGSGIEAPARDDPVLLVGVQNPEARGRLRLRAGDVEGTPELEYRYLGTAADRARARAAVRFALTVLDHPAFAAVSTGRGGPDDAVRGDDDALDAWLLAHLGTAQHLCGTAPMGAPDDRMAVTDARGAVRGTSALHVADLALLPTVPSRGPAVTAVLIGERIAELLGRV